jgi:hypothetical protein
MIPDPPPPLTPEELPEGGVRYTLPRTRKALDRQMAVVILSSSALFLAAWLVGMAQQCWRCIVGRAEDALLVLVVNAVAVLVGLWLLRVGLLKGPGCRRTVEIRGDFLRVVERVGPLTRVRARRLADIGRLEVRPGSPTPGGSGPDRLVAVGAGLPLLLVDDLPPASVKELAAELARRCRPEAPLPVAVSSSAAAADAPSEQPADSRASVRSDSNGLTIELPPLPWRRAGGVLVFCTAWLFITVIHTWIGFTASWHREHGYVAFLSIFWAIGLAFTTLFVRVVSEHTRIRVEGDELIVTRFGPLGTRRRRWHRTEVAAIDLGPSSMPHEKGKRSPPELKVTAVGGGKYGLLAGRDEAELRWIAGRLRKVLRPGGDAGPPRPPELTERPEGSRAELERWDGDGFRLTLPAPGLRRQLAWLLGIGLLLLAAAAAVGGGVLTAAPPWDGLQWGVLVAAGLAGLFGAALVLEAAAFARKRREVSVSGVVLRLGQTTPLGPRTREWAREELTAVEVCGREGKVWPLLPQLRLHLRDGGERKLLTYCEEDELLWVATLLRQALRLPASPPAVTGVDAAPTHAV